MDVFHVKHEGLAAAAAALGLDLATVQVEQLAGYEELLSSRGADLGVVAAGDLPRLRERHILDSLRAVAHLHAARSVYDLGSGGGLPGIPIAIAASGVEIVLVEARRGRAAFLELVIDQLSLVNASVHLGRAEGLTRKVDLVTARAFAGAPEAWRTAEPLLTPGGRLVYFAGTGFDPARISVPGADLTLFRSPPLARSGYLAIMSRQ